MRQQEATMKKYFKQAGYFAALFTVLLFTACGTSSQTAERKTEKNEPDVPAVSLQGKPIELRVIAWSLDGSRIVTIYSSNQAKYAYAYVWDTATVSLSCQEVSGDKWSVAQNNDGTIAVGGWPAGWLRTYNDGQIISEVDETAPDDYRIKKRMKQSPPSMTT
jgi:hypothetical protein